MTLRCATVNRMNRRKAYIHARLGTEERALLEQLKQATGRTESEIVRRGLRMVAEAEGKGRSASRRRQCRAVQEGPDGSVDEQTLRFDFL